MGNTLLIELNNEKARNLIKDLEDLDIITVPNETIQKPKKWAEKFKGFLTKEEGFELNKHIKNSRNQWVTI